MAQSPIDETAKQKSQGVMPVDEAERHKQRNKRWWDERVAVSHMIPGYRSLYKQNGITKLQVQIGRTKSHRLTPEQEHKERTDGEREKRIRNTLERNNERTHELDVEDKI